MQTSPISLSSALPLEVPPLRGEDVGTLRIGCSRLTLDLLVEQYESGMSVEDFVKAYVAVSLAEDYGVLAYYLRHGAAVDTYLQRRTTEANVLRGQIEFRGRTLTRSELRARRS